MQNLYVAGYFVFATFNFGSGLGGTNLKQGGQLGEERKYFWQIVSAYGTI